MKTGDAIATVAQPIARTVDYFFGTDLRNCSGCKKMQHNLNVGMSLADALYDRFWKKQKEGETMQYIVSKTQNEQIAIEAENPKEALEKVKKGEGQVTSTSENFGVMARPAPPTQPPR